MLNHRGSLQHWHILPPIKSVNIPDSLKAHAADHADVMLVCVSDMRLCVVLPFIMHVCAVCLSWAGQTRQREVISEYIKKQRKENILLAHPIRYGK